MPDEEQVPQEVVDEAQAAFEKWWSDGEKYRRLHSRRWLGEGPGPIDLSSCDHEWAGWRLFRAQRCKKCGMSRL